MLLVTCVRHPFRISRAVDGLVDDKVFGALIDEADAPFPRRDVDAAALIEVPFEAIGVSAKEWDAFFCRTIIHWWRFASVYEW
jgi:hypothetical protein